MINPMTLARRREAAFDRGGRNFVPDENEVLTVVLDRRGQTEDEYRDSLRKAERSGTSPEPPEVDLLLKCRNPSTEERTLHLEDERANLSLEMNGPGVLRAKAPDRTNAFRPGGGDAGSRSDVCVADSSIGRRKARRGVLPILDATGRIYADDPVACPGLRRPTQWTAAESCLSGSQLGHLRQPAGARQGGREAVTVNRRGWGVLVRV
jgi:hypothetical protein